MKRLWPAHVALVTFLSVGPMTAQTLSGNPDATVNLGNSTTSAFHIFNSSNTELLRVQADGNVGIGMDSIASTMKLSIGGTGRVFGVANSSTFAAQNSSGTYENYLTPRHTDNVMYLNYGTGGFNIRNAADLTSMFMDNAGNVSVGATWRGGVRLDVYGPARFGYGFTTMPNPVYGGIQIGEYGAGGAGELQFLTAAAGNGYGFRFRGASNAALLLERRWASSTFSDFMSFNDYGVGIGTTSPIGLLQIGPAGSNYPARFVDTLPTLGIQNGVLLDMMANSEIHIANLQIGTLATPVIQTTGAAGVSPLYLNRDSDNDVFVGKAGAARGLKVQSTGMSTFAGSVTVDGTLYANYQDVAEWVPAAELLPAGTVVVLSDEVANTVTASKRAYDTGVAGVVSPAPGLLLGIAGPSKAKVATTGRVRVRVDATQSPIRIGDLLVTSDRLGMAMKSQPLDVAGAKIHRPGTLIGKALEPLPGGVGEILVLLSLQ